MTNTKIHFIYGEDAFLVEEQVNIIKTQFLAEAIDCYENKIEIQSLFEAISTSGLFVQSKLIIFKNPWFLFETLQDKDDSRLKSLLSQAENGEHTIVCYVLDKKIDHRRKFPVFLKRIAKTVECKSFKDWEQDKLMNWMKLRIEKQGKKIDRNALITLAQIEGSNLRHIAGEIEKICVYVGDKKDILLSDINAVAIGINASIYPLNEAMKTKNLAVIMNFACHALQNGDHPVRILALILSSIRFYYQILLLMNQKTTNQEIGRILGKNPYFINMTALVIKKNYTIKTLEQAFKKLHETDLAIKSGKLNPQIALILAITGVFGKN